MFQTPPLTGETRRAIATASVVQCIGWGTSYFLPGILHQQLSDGLSIPGTLVFAGVTEMVLVSALVSIRMGKWIDRHGAYWAMAAGSFLLALGLSVLATAQGPIGYILAWGLFGLAMPLGLSSGASAALTQIAGPRARFAITVMLVFSGVSQSIFWPLTAWLDGLYGWRATCLIFAGLNLLICLPLNLLTLRGAKPLPVNAEKADPLHQGQISDAAKGRALLLIVLSIGLNGFVSWGVELHFVNLLAGLGLPAAMAIGVVALRGPASMCARFVNLMTTERFSSLDGSIAGTLVTVTALLLGLWFAGGTVGAVLFMVLYSFGNGFLVAARATLPLEIFGPAGYATLLGRVALPTQIAFAVSPPIYAFIVERFGAIVALDISLLFLVSALVALLALRRLAIRERRVHISGQIF